jgi:thioredoxin reductase
MSLNRGEFQAVVIGLGPSGLATSYLLKEQNISYVALEKSDRAGYSWTQTWDSLKLAMPASQVYMPGLKLNKKKYPDDHHLSRDQIIKILHRFAKKHELRIDYNTKVLSVTKERGIFHVETNQGKYTAENVVVCVGARHDPKFPKFVTELSSQQYLHNSEYKNPEMLNLPEQSHVLVVGSNLSALDIAKELREKNHHVFLACKTSDFRLLKINKHLLASFSFMKARMPSKLSEQGVKNLGELVLIKGNELIFAGGQIVKKEFFQKIIFATGYEFNFPFFNHASITLNKIKKIPGLFTVGIPKPDEKTVTINQGSQQAEEVVQRIRARVEDKKHNRPRSRL